MGAHVSAWQPSLRGPAEGARPDPAGQAEEPARPDQEGQAGGWREADCAQQRPPEAPSRRMLRLAATRPAPPALGAATATAASPMFVSLPSACGETEGSFSFADSLSTVSWAPVTCCCGGELSFIRAACSARRLRRTVSAMPRKILDDNCATHCELWYNRYTWPPPAQDIQTAFPAL